MASLHHHAAVLLTLSLLAGCGRERSRAGAGTDTTGAAAATPDSAAMPAADTAAAAPARDTTAPTQADSTKPRAADTAKRQAAAPEPKAPAKAPAPPASAAKPAAESTQTAAAPTPAPAPSSAGQQQQDTQQDTTSQAPLRDAYHQAPRDTVTQAVYDGWKQFNLNCARCHGEDVLGTTIAPHLIVSLKPDGPINTKELFVQTVCAGRPAKGMPAWCALGLDMGKINDIYLYVKGRSDAKIGPGRPAVKKTG